MAISTVHLRVDDLAPIVLRRPFEMALNRDKVPVADPKTGEPIFYAEAILPGLVPGRFSMEPSVGSVRLRVNGANPGAGTVVRLDGKVTISATYARGNRMSDRNSHITVTAERVRPVNGERPGGRGFLPAYLPVNGLLVDARPQAENDPQNPRWVADIALEPSSSYVVDGLAEVILAGPVPDGLLGQSVRPVDLRVRYTSPDSVDVSQRSRAELLLSASYLEEAAGATATPTPPTRNRPTANVTEGEAAA